MMTRFREWFARIFFRTPTAQEIAPLIDAEALTDVIVTTRKVRPNPTIPSNKRTRKRQVSVFVSFLLRETRRNYGRRVTATDPLCAYQVARDIWTDLDEQHDIQLPVEEIEMLRGAVRDQILADGAAPNGVAELEIT